MNRFLLIIISAVLLFCCNSKTEKLYISPNVKKAVENPDFSGKVEYVGKNKDNIVDEDGPKDFRPKELKPLPITKEDVMGIWKGDYDDGPNATMAIYEDSLLNVEHLESFKYELKSDTLIVDFGDWKSISIVIKAEKDTLILLDENGETLYTTFKD